VYLGGSGRGNWELVVSMTTLGRQAVRFTGSPRVPGSTSTPVIAGSVDADNDGRAGHVTSTVPPAAYAGVRCGDLPQQAS